MTTRELCDALGISSRQLTAWRKRGLPATKTGRGYRYDAAAVRRWLIDQGLAKPQAIATTRADVAEHFGVHERTVAGWIAAGAPGSPGRYDLDAIAAWRDARRGKGDDPELAGPASAGLERYRQARAAIAELELARLRRQLVPREEVHAVLDQVATTLRRAGEILARHHGDEARQVLEDAIDDARRLLEQINTAETIHPKRESP